MKKKKKRGSRSYFRNVHSIEPSKIHRSTFYPSNVIPIKVLFEATDIKYRALGARDVSYRNMRVDRKIERKGEKTMIIFISLIFIAINCKILKRLLNRIIFLLFYLF